MTPQYFVNNISRSAGRAAVSLLLGKGAATVAVLAALCCSSANASAIGWYNGDPVNNFNVGVVNGIDLSFGNANTYDDFVVPTGGWNIVSVFVDDEMNFTGVTQAEWEIRSGVSTGTGGTLIASGTSSATQTSLGLSGRGFTMYKIEVDSLNVNLGAGKYWLSVAPVGFGGSDSSSSAFTTGANAVGTPPGNDEGTFLNSPTLGFNFAQVTSGGSIRDWSMGVLIDSSSPAPEPGTLGQLAIGGLLLGTVMFRRGARIRAGAQPAKRNRSCNTLLHLDKGDRH